MMRAGVSANPQIDNNTSSFVDKKIPIFASWFILIFVALNPFPHTTTIREVAYYLALVFAVIYCVRKKEWRFLNTPLTLPAALFVLWVFIGLFTAIDLARSLHDLRSHLLEYIALFCMLVLFVNTHKKMVILGWLIVLSVTVSSVLGLYEFYFVEGHNWSARFISSDPQSPVGPVGFMAAYAAMFALHLFRIVENVWSRLLLGCCLLVLLATIYFVQTRAILVAMPFAFIVLFWRNKKILAFFLLLSFCFGFITLTKFRPWNGTSQYIERLTINYISFLLVKEHPITGIGFGIATFGDPNFIDHEYYRAQLPEKIKYVKFDITSPHNMWAGITVRTGIVGLVLFSSIMFLGAKMCKTIIRAGPDDLTKGWGYFGGATLVFFGVYGLFNAVFLHFIEMLLCVSFAVVAINYLRNKSIFQKI